MSSEFNPGTRHVDDKRTEGPRVNCKYLLTDTNIPSKSELLCNEYIRQSSHSIKLYGIKTLSFLN